MSHVCMCVCVCAGTHCALNHSESFVSAGIGCVVSHNKPCVCVCVCMLV